MFDWDGDIINSNFIENETLFTLLTVKSISTPSS